MIEKIVHKLKKIPTKLHKVRYDLELSLFENKKKKWQL